MRWFDAIWTISVPPIAPRALRREPASRGEKLILGAKRPIFLLWLKYSDGPIRLWALGG